MLRLDYIACAIAFVFALILLVFVSYFLSPNKTLHSTNSSYAIHCIENIRYIEMNGHFGPKYSTSGEVETCELEE